MRFVHFSRSFSLLLMLAAVLAATPFSPAAGPAPDWSTFQADTRLSETAQLDPAVQARYQTWFLKRVEEFVNMLNATAIGQTVHLGDMAVIRGRFGPPAGAGDWTIVWRNQNGLGPTKEPGEPFYFPTDAAQGGYIYFEPDKALVELVATCWHEVQHGFLAGASLSAPGFHAADQEHFYIEGLAQNTTEWLWWLAIRLKFEDLAREAAAAMAEYETRGETLTYAAERHLWAKAHAAWRQAWDKTRSPGKTIVSPDSPLLDEYERLAGVRVPAVEEVIRFYMSGGVKDKTGQPIRVPEWVMVENPVRAVVIIDKTPGSEERTPPEKGGSLRHSFEISVREITRPPGRPTWVRRPVDRGTLTCLLDTDDDDALLTVHLAGQRLAGVAGPGGPSGRMIHVSLAHHKTALQKNTPLRVTFVHGQPASIRGKKAYRIVVTYEDDPTSSAGSGELLYHSSEAVYWIDVTGKAGQATPAGGTGTGSGSVTGASTGGPSTAGAAAGRWVMTRHWTTQYHTTHRPSFGFGLKPGNGQARTSITIPDRSGPITTTFHFQWDRPPDVIPWYSSSDPPVTITATVTGIDWPGMNIGTVAAAMEFYSGHRRDPAPEANLISHRDFRGEKSISRKDVEAGKAHLPFTQTFAWNFPHHLGSPEEGRQIITVRMIGTISGGSTVIHAHYEYTWEPGAPPAAPAETTGEVTSELREEPAPEPTPDPALDNEPPRKGEVVPVVRVEPKVTPPPPEKKKPAPGNWYVHPTGDWRFPLPADFLLAGEAEEGTDLILKRDESIAVICQRAPVSLKPGTEARVMDQLIGNWRQDDPRAVIDRLVLGGRPAAQLSYRDAEDGNLVREIHLFGHGRAYTILLILEPGRTDPALLAPADSMIRGLRFDR